MTEFNCFGTVPSWQKDLQEQFGSTGECPAGKREFWIEVVIPYQTIDVKIFLGEDEIIFDEKERVFRDIKTWKRLKDVFGRYAAKAPDGSMIFKQ